MVRNLLGDQTGWELQYSVDILKSIMLFKP